MSLSPLASRTPGVYIDEINAFPNSIVPVATAIPAFIGYTPRASYEGKSLTNQPVMINSFQEFVIYFLLPDLPAPAAPAVQYSPQYYLNSHTKPPAKGDYYQIGSEIYTVEPDPGSIYYLYNSVRLFYQNGGGTAYVVSVGDYGKPIGKPIEPGARVENPNVRLTDLLGGLSVLEKIPEITLYSVPEATLLSSADNSTLIQKMLLQCENLETAFSLFDVKGGESPDPILYTQDIENFRNSTGNEGLRRSAAYYPFLKTTITTINEVTYENINGGDTSVLEPLINPSTSPNQAAEHILFQIKNPPQDMTPRQLNQALTNVSTSYKKLMRIVTDKINILPTAGAMAGIYTVTDNSRGVWHSPANVTPIGVVGLTLKINDSMQAGLNVDAVSGKSINAIRFFNGQGILVWGARTLDGNSQDWRYISVRRTMTMIEQSIKLGCRSLVFEPNDANTWATAKSMTENFLTNLWKEGALQGGKAADAFSVSVGLGSTMTAQDILDGIMRVSVKLALTHPAEFIVIEVVQQMATSS